MTNLSIKTLNQQLKSREKTCRSLVEETFDRIQKTDDQVNAFLSTANEAALHQADLLDQQYDKGDDLSPMAGIPIGIKDNICIAGEKTTCGSKILENYVSPYNATVIEKLRSVGMIPVGKLNMDEFAMGSSTENSAYFTTKNPWKLSAVPGGSSGGSAACVASRETLVSLGSDTGGSIRQPAAFCGLVGLKPTYGRVSRYGLVAFASSLDQIGPFAQTVEDAAYVLNAISGFDPLDSTSINQAVPDYTADLNGPINKMKIGVPKELLGDAIDAGIKETFISALDVFKQQGAIWDEV